MAEGDGKHKMNPEPSQARVKEEKEDCDLQINPAPSVAKVKQEKEDYDSQDGHSHQFNFKFSDKDRMYTLNPVCPATVLEALKTHSEYNAKKYKDENVVITLSMQDRQVAVATHFPCHLIEDDKVLEIYKTSKKVEEIKPDQETPSQGDYVTFFIDKTGGANTTTKQLLRSNTNNQFDYLCVYAEKRMTVEEALKRDGRFIDNLSNFTLSDEADSDSLTYHTQSVEKLDGKFFKICLPRTQGPENIIAKSIVSGKKRISQTKQKNQEASHDSQNSSKTSGANEALLDLVSWSGKNVKSVSNDDEETLKLLREQFPALKKLMESRFPGDSLQKALNLKKENFGKIQQAFSEVHRVRQLLASSESVCKVIVENFCQGTGFILFDNFILTNGHLLKDCDERLEDTMQLPTDVYAVFNYEKPSGGDWFRFKVKKTIIDFSYSGGSELDYAILELDRDTLAVGPDTKASRAQKKLPPGLLKKCGPVPKNGEACIIGHPAGGVKQMDPTCIIEKEKRGEAALSHYKDTLLTLHSIKQVLNQGIMNIMQGGPNVDKVGTYNTFMYHGSSGSPVFDAHCRVFGLHTAGFTYGFSGNEKSVIEYAHPLIDIFKNFVMKLKDRKDDKLLQRVLKEVENNPHLKEVGESNSDDEPMETDG
ncbi:protein FAM111A-like isoform X2 [Myripristis murdjan]|nr:protein FAM111A-like isoform X2 [Myripristis murdjan]XP_029926185.1 protein FAM111A-like isoform X2 [Myripristis murdjan]